MKCSILLILIVFSSFSLFSQKYGNEWINYNQKYYSFQIIHPGIYKLDYNDLVAANIPVTTFSSQNIQLFGKEKEIPLYISDGGDSSLDPGDYILFYGDRNDGWIDSSLYKDPNWIGNPTYNLFNDTLHYFFTWNNSTSNLRFSEEKATDYQNYTPSNFIIGKFELSHHSYYNEGGDRVSVASSSFYKPGEGFGTAPQNGVNGTGGFTFNLNANTDSPYLGSDAPLPFFHGISTTNSEADYTGSGNHHLQWKIGNSDHVLYDKIISGYNCLRVNQTFPISLLNNGSTPVKWSIIDDQGALTDVQTLNYWSILYPKIPTINGASLGIFWIKNNSLQSKIRLDLAGVSMPNPVVFVLNGGIPKKVNLTSNNGLHSMLVSNSTNGVDQEIIMQDISTVLHATNLKPVNGTGVFTDFSLVNPEAALLMIYSPVLEEQSNEYKSYRESTTGGSYSVLMTNVEELYLQFGGGIRKHIQAIRRFSFFMYDRATVKPVGLFLVGKAVSLANSGVPFGTPGSRMNAASYAMSLIPTFGEPASDVSITADFKNDKWSPLIPTGRISVSTNLELANYLSKIKEYESHQNQTSVYSTQEKDWQKQILHFGGGSNASQQTTFQGFLNVMESRIKQASFGGHVTRIYKNTSVPFDPTILNDITTRIRNGVSLITFFGHASSSGFEINLDNPNNWNNKGKYPILLSNSCYTGNMFSSSSTTFTEYVNVKNGGVIAFIGSAGEGLDQPLGQFSKELYNQFSIFNYGKTISDQIKSTIENLQSSGYKGLLLETTASQMNLNGDPMLRLNWHAKPEIEIIPEEVWFTPKNLDLTVDSIEIHVVLTNLGKAITDTFSLEIRRDFPLSVTDSVYSIPITYLNYKDTVVFKVPMQPNIGLGINTITISADIPSVIPEQYDEINNNQVSKPLFIDIDGILPVIPPDFAVVPSDSVTLKASTIDPIAGANIYRFEIDTTDLFNSPELRYATISDLGGVKEVFPSDWKLVSTNQKAKLTCKDSTVYFWRVAIDGPTIKWYERSFQYIKGKTGWGQSHFFQFKKNGFHGITYNRTNRQREFEVGTPDTVKIVVLPGKGIANASYLNGQQLDYGTCQTPLPSLNVIVFDPITHIPWGTRYVPTGANLNNNFGNSNDNGTCRTRSMKFFTFPQTNTAYLDAFQDMVLNKVPEGSYMFIYTQFGAKYDAWTTFSPNLFNTFLALGADSISPDKPNYNFALFCKKGDPSSLIEKYALNSSETVELAAPLPKKEYLGNETSTLIGPSSKWDAVYWKRTSLENPTNDSNELHIKAYDIHRSFQFSLDTLLTPNDSILNLSSLIDATKYPYLNLSVDYMDSLSFSPSQLNHWQVLFQPLPEAAIDGTKKVTWIPTKDTLIEGEKVKFAVDIKNIFTVDMDSLLVNYWIEDASHTKHFLPILRKKPLLANAIFRDTIEFSTIGFSGLNSLWMEVNPYINGSLFITDQPEQEHFNNLLQLPFVVKGDKINPILDVTFSGRHILNNDIVSPTSEIVITLKDENQYLVMDSNSDTSRFGVYVIDPKGNQKRIPFMNSKGETVMQWIPADAQNKKFKIIYPALFEENGKYTLMIQGTDRSENLSGDLQYRVNFEVVKESQITYLMNYPNPFSTSTRFVFTLTGSVVPENMIIQIMTVSGKVVREISEAELGRVYIGRNITEFAWDGTDEFGDPLANGVYLYRVKAQINGQDIEHRSSGGDAYFTKDFGKMYIIR